MNELGNLRPSQLIHTFGVGSLVDLPNMSVLILGLDDWDIRQCSEIVEDRLLAALQKRFGPRLKKLFLPPVDYEEEVRDPAAPPHGVPVAPFPRWLRCPICDILATIESGTFQFARDARRPDRSRYVHGSCTKAQNPTALPVRFLRACRDGHLTDFPWVAYVHARNIPCKPARLTLREYGAAGDVSDIIIKCLECNAERRMMDAFDPDRFQSACAGHHPHLRLIETSECEEEARTILLGASNSWFPLVMSALSVPRATDRLALLVEEHWLQLKDIPSLDVTRYVTAPSRMPTFVEYSAEQIWTAIEQKKQSQTAGGADETDLKVPEWEVLTQQTQPAATKDFKIRQIAAPQSLDNLFEPTLLLERVREVRALLAFTRIEPKGDFADTDYIDDDRQTPLCRQAPTWLPVSEVRGEGIFLRLKENALQAWENQPAVQELDRDFFDGHRKWRRLRHLEPDNAGFPGIRYALLHSLSHALMRQIALECGYTAASIRERIYCKLPGENHGPMAGILIYTAASDSEGTLGGLVSLGEPQPLGRHIQQALEAMRICASDPLCSEHPISGDGRAVHGACCHACLFASETSCERGNRYLDRSVLTMTFASKGTAFFTGV